MGNDGKKFEMTHARFSPRLDNPAERVLEE
jgi:hypothetical protein